MLFLSQERYYMDITTTNEKHLQCSPWDFQLNKVRGELITIQLLLPFLLALTEEGLGDEFRKLGPIKLIQI